MIPSARTEESIFAEALGKATVAERANYLLAACGDDAGLLARVEKLLKSHEEAGNFMRRSPDQLVQTADYEPIVEGPGTVIGRYKLMEQIGEGGMGLVFVAEQQEPIRRKVAIKIIKPGMDTREVIARFEAERQALALMDHPNIAKVLDAGTTGTEKSVRSVFRPTQDAVLAEEPGPTNRSDTFFGGRPYFVMELVKGIPIIDYCDQQRLSARERLELFLSVCQAVQHAHGKGIIHRDLKPSNIMVAPHDGVPVVKVIDFGVAKAIGQQLTDKTIYTRFTQMIGTPLYMSPEQAEINALDVDVRSDIYSLGVLLYELLTGTTPFERERFATAAYDEIRRIIREEEPPKPSTRLSTLGANLATVSARRKTEPTKLEALVKGDLDWIVMKAMEKDRSRRYETANGFAMDVQRYLADEPVQAGPPGAGYRLRKFVKRHRGSVLASGVVAAALVVAVVGTSLGLVQALRSEKRAVAARDDALRTADANAQLTKELTVLAETERHLRKDAQRLTVDMLFEQSHARCLHEDAAIGLSALAHTLEEAARIETPELMASVRLQLGAWQREIYPLRAVIVHEDAILDGVHTVAFSPDGSLFITGYASQEGGVGGWAGGKVQRWDAKTGKAVGPPLQHSGPVLAVAFSPDGKTIAAGTELHEEGKIRGEVRYWETDTGKQLLPSIKLNGAVAALAFSPNGKTLLTATRLQFGGGEGRLWDVATRKPLSPPVGHQVGAEAACFSPDSTRFALAGVAPQVWEVGSWKDPKAVLSKHFKIHSAVVFNPKGTTILSAGWDTTALLWDANSGQLLGPLLRNPTGFRSAAYSKDGATIVTACRDRTARLWDASTGLPLGPPLRHQSGVNAAAVSPDGKTIVTVSEDRTARVWDVAADWLPAPVAVARIWEPGAGRPLGQRRVPLQQHGKGKVQLFDGGKYGGKLWGVMSWERAEGPVQLAGPDGKPMSSPQSWDQALGPVLAFSPDGTLVVTANSFVMAKAQVWEVATGKARGPILDTMFGQLCAAFSRDNKQLFIGSDFDDRAGMLWEVETGKSIGSPLTRQNMSRSGNRALAVFSPDGQAIFTAVDGVAKLWEPGTWRSLGTTIELQQSISAVAFRPDGRAVMLAAGSEARLWDVQTGAPKSPSFRHQGSITVVAISPDSRVVLTGSTDQSARLWDAATGKSVGPALLHDAEVAAAAFSPDGKVVLTASKDNTVRLWDAATGKPLGSPRLHGGGWVTAAAFGQGGRTFLTGTPAFIWDTPASVAGDVERVRLWVQVSTGLELDENRAVRVLDGATWHARKQRLHQLGGPPTW